MKVSFDFDSTLSRKCVQDYAQELIFRGFEVHIVTSRFEKAALNRSNSYNNADLFGVAERLGIPKERIHFTNGANKSWFFKENPDFLFHLDNDFLELEDIQRISKIKAISCWTNPNWIKKCARVIIKVIGSELRKEWEEMFKNYHSEGEDELMIPDFVDLESDRFL